MIVPVGLGLDEIDLVQSPPRTPSKPPLPSRVPTGGLLDPINRKDRPQPAAPEGRRPDQFSASIMGTI